MDAPAFFEWLMPATWEIPPRLDEQTTGTIKQLQLLYAEYTSGHRDSDEVHALASSLERKLRSTAAA